MSQLLNATWDPDLDDTDGQRALRSEMLTEYTPGVQSASASDYHALHNAREYLKAENQRNMGSCQGQALTTCGEKLIWAATGMRVQLSRMFGYIRTQIKDGIRGDRGSSLTGGVWVFKNVGLPQEQHMPYPNPVRYSQVIPGAATKHAGECVLLESVRLRSYESTVSFLREEGTVVMIGTAWGGNVSSPRGRIERFRPGNGAHATVLSQVSPETVDKNEPDLDWVNSHGIQWGDKGVCPAAPGAIREVLDHRMTKMLGGFIGMRGVKLDPDAYPDPLDQGKGGMLA